MTKICLTCKVSKSMNIGRIRKSYTWIGIRKLEIILYYHLFLIIMINIMLRNQLYKFINLIYQIMK